MCGIVGLRDVLERVFGGFGFFFVCFVDVIFGFLVSLLRGFRYVGFYIFDFVVGF